MAQHVRMRLDLEAGGRACPLDHPAESANLERRAALAGAEGRYLLVLGSEKRQTDIPDQRCPVFGSSDGRTWVQDSPGVVIPPTCAGGTDQWLTATRFRTVVPGTPAFAQSVPGRHAEQERPFP
jgi:hypothetical protein